MRLFVLLFLAATAFAAADPEIEILLAQVRAHARDAGEQLFPGYGTAPFGLLLELDGREVLLCHKPVKGFTPGEIDTATGCTRQLRAGQHFSGKLLAAMPA